MSIPANIPLGRLHIQLLRSGKIISFPLPEECGLAGEEAMVRAPRGSCSPFQGNLVAFQGGQGGFPPGFTVKGEGILRVGAAGSQAVFDVLSSQSRNFTVLRECQQAPKN